MVDRAPDEFLNSTIQGAALACFCFIFGIAFAGLTLAAVKHVCPAYDGSEFFYMEPHFYTPCTCDDWGKQYEGTWREHRPPRACKDTQGGEG